MSEQETVVEEFGQITNWTLEEGVELCRRIEEAAPLSGCHVGLTGGVLYKDGPRKDLDLVFYRIRQEEAIDTEGLFAALEVMGIHVERRFGWVVKATFSGRSIDMMFPEFIEYRRATEDDGPGDDRFVERVRFISRFDVMDIDPDDPGRYQ